MGPASSSLRDSRPDQGFSVGDPCICLRPFCESPGLCVAAGDGRGPNGSGYIQLRVSSHQTISNYRVQWLQGQRSKVCESSEDRNLLG